MVELEGQPRQQVLVDLRLAGTVAGNAVGDEIEGVRLERIEAVEA